MPARLYRAEQPSQFFLFVFFKEALQLSMDFFNHFGVTPHQDDAKRFFGPEKNQGSHQTELSQPRTTRKP